MILPVSVPGSSATNPLNISAGASILKVFVLAPTLPSLILLPSVSSPMINCAVPLSDKSTSLLVLPVNL